MNLYLTFVLLLIIFGLVAAALKRRERDAMFSVAVLFFASLFLGVREASIGTDTREYLAIFESNGFGFSHIEPGYLGFIRAIRLFSDSTVAYLIVQAFVVNLAIYYSYRVFVGRFALLIVALLACTHVFWVVHFQLLRNGMAAALFLVAVAAHNYFRTRASILFTVASISVHYVSAVPIVVSFAADRLCRSGLKPRTILLFALLVFFPLLAFYWYGSLLLTVVDSHVTKFDAYTYMADNGLLMESSFKFHHVPAAMLLLLSWLKWATLDSTYRRLFSVYASIICASVIFWSNVVMKDRIYIYAQLLEPVLMFMFLQQGRARQVTFPLLLSVFIAWAVLIIFLWGPANLLTHYRNEVL